MAASLAVEAIGELLTSDLDCSPAVQSGVTALPDLAHPAAPNGRDDLVRAEPRATFESFAARINATAIVRTLGGVDRCLHASMVECRWSLAFQTLRILITHGKTPAARRFVPMSDRVFRRLARRYLQATSVACCECFACFGVIALDVKDDRHDCVVCSAGLQACFAALITNMMPRSFSSVERPDSFGHVLRKKSASIYNLRMKPSALSLCICEIRRVRRWPSPLGVQRHSYSRLGRRRFEAAARPGSPRTKKSA